VSAGPSSCRPQPNTKIQVYRDEECYKSAGNPPAFANQKPIAQPVDQISRRDQKASRMSSKVPSSLTTHDQYSDSELATQLYKISKERESLLIRLQELNNKESHLISQLVNGGGINQS
jgi:hypothetical protein